jgi:pimeloyl-ACP methyl ester carboxylesterase
LPWGTNTVPAMSRFTTDDGVELQYEVWGEGEPTVLLLPNWISTLESMRWAEPLTAAGVRVVAYELRGTGRSDRPAPTDDNYTVERLAADAIGLAESLAPEQLVVSAGSRLRTTRCAWRSPGQRRLWDSCSRDRCWRRSPGVPCR